MKAKALQIDLKLGNPDPNSNRVSVFSHDLQEELSMRFPATQEQVNEFKAKVCLAIDDACNYASKRGLIDVQM